MIPREAARGEPCPSGLSHAHRLGRDGDLGGEKKVERRFSN